MAPPPHPTPPPQQVVNSKKSACCTYLATRKHNLHHVFYIKTSTNFFCTSLRESKKSSNLVFYFSRLFGNAFNFYFAFHMSGAIGRGFCGPVGEFSKCFIKYPSRRSSSACFPHCRIFSWTDLQQKKTPAHTDSDADPDPDL